MKCNISIEEIKQSGIFANIPKNDKKNLGGANHNIESYFFEIAKKDGLSSELVELSKNVGGIMSMYIDNSKIKTIFMPRAVFPDGRRTFAMDDLDQELSQLLFDILESDLCDNIFVKSRIYDVIWIKKSINKPFEAGKKAIDNYKSILETSIKNNDFHLAGEILQRYHCLVLELGNKFVGRRDYIRKLKQLAKIPICEDGLYFFCKLWESILEICGSEKGFCEKVAADIQAYLFNTANKVNGGFKEHASDILCKYYRVLKNSVDETKILKWQAEKFSIQADNIDFSYQKINLFCRAIECYKRITGNPCKSEIDTLYAKIQQVQKNPTPLGMVTSKGTDITKLVQPTKEHFGDKDFPTCVMGLWYMKHHFISMEKNKNKKGQYSPLLNLFAMTHSNHRGRAVANTTGQHQDNLSRNISRGLFLAAYVTPLMNIIKNNFSFNHTAFGDFMIYNNFVPKGYERMFSKGFDYFFKGMFLEAATILIPLLENSFRYIIEDKHPMIYKKTDSDVFHEKIDIADIIAKVKQENIFDDIILSHVEELMINPIINIRNYIAHGMYSENYFYTEDVKILMYFIFVLTTNSFFEGILQESKKEI